MPLVTTPKAASSVSGRSSGVPERQSTSIGRQSSSTARLDALKQRLMEGNGQPVAPRRAGSSARVEQMSQLTKYPSPPPPAISKRPVPAQDLSQIEPPPSGLAQPTSSSIENQSPPPAEATKPEANDPQFAALARKERQLRKAQQELKAREEAWKQSQANYVSRDELKSNPLKVLADLGITGDKLVELQVNQAAPPDPNQQLLDKIAELENKLAGITDPENGVLAKRDQEAYQHTIRQIREDAEVVVDSNPDFATIKAENKVSDVVELIEAVFNAEGKVLDVEEACRLVEDKLTSNLVQQYERLSKIDKIKARLGKLSENTAEVIQAQQTPPSTKPVLTTLTNTGAATKPLSPRDRAVMLVQARIDALKGK